MLEKSMEYARVAIDDVMYWFGHVLDVAGHWWRGVGGRCGYWLQSSTLLPWMLLALTVIGVTIYAITTMCRNYLNHGRRGANRERKGGLASPIGRRRSSWEKMDYGGSSRSSVAPLVAVNIGGKMIPTNNEVGDHGRMIQEGGRMTSRSVPPKVDSPHISSSSQDINKNIKNRMLSSLFESYPFSSVPIDEVQISSMNREGRMPSAYGYLQSQQSMRQQHQQYPMGGETMQKTTSFDVPVEGLQSHLNQTSYPNQRQNYNQANESSEEVRGRTWRRDVTIRRNISDEESSSSSSQGRSDQDDDWLLSSSSSSIESIESSSGASLPSHISMANSSEASSSSSDSSSIHSGWQDDESSSSCSISSKASSSSRSSNRSKQSAKSCKSKSSSSSSSSSLVSSSSRHSKPFKYQPIRGENQVTTIFDDVTIEQIIGGSTSTPSDEIDSDDGYTSHRSLHSNRSKNSKRDANLQMEMRSSATTDSSRTASIDSTNLPLVDSSPSHIATDDIVCPSDVSLDAPKVIIHRPTAIPASSGQNPIVVVNLDD